MANQPKIISQFLFNIKDTIKKRQKYVRNDYQAYGLDLASELKDWKNRSLYIRLAKNLDHRLLESARNFVKDQTISTIRNPARLFMWKLKELRKDK